MARNIIIALIVVLTVRSASAVEFSIDPSIQPRRLTLERLFGHYSTGPMGNSNVDLWQAVCTMPCTAELSLSDRYRLIAPGIPFVTPLELAPASLPSHTMVVLARVPQKPSYWATIVGSLLLGIGSTAGGIALASTSANDTAHVLRPLGVTFGVLGGVLATLSAVILIAGPTTVPTLQTRPAP